MTVATKDVCSMCLRGRHPDCTSASCRCETCNPPKIVWEDPPENRGRRTGPFLEPDVVQELRANVGRWAKVRTYKAKTSANGAAAKVRKGELDGFPSAEWEAVGRACSGGSALYVRFVGKPVKAVAQ